MLAWSQKSKNYFSFFNWYLLTMWNVFFWIYVKYGFLIGKVRKSVSILHHFTSFLSASFFHPKKLCSQIFSFKKDFKSIMLTNHFSEFFFQSSFRNPILDIYFCPKWESKNPFKLIILGYLDLQYLYLIYIIKQLKEN